LRILAGNYTKGDQQKRRQTLIFEVGQYTYSHYFSITQNYISSVSKRKGEVGWEALEIISLPTMKTQRFSLPCLSFASNEHIIWIEGKSVTIYHREKATLCAHLEVVSEMETDLNKLYFWMNEDGSTRWIVGELKNRGHLSHLNELVKKLHFFKYDGGEEINYFSPSCELREILAYHGDFFAGKTGEKYIMEVYRIEGEKLVKWMEFFTTYLSLISFWKNEVVL